MHFDFHCMGEKIQRIKFFLLLNILHKKESHTADRICFVCTITADELLLHLNHSLLHHVPGNQADV